MKKFSTAFLLVFITALSYAQPKIGLILSPGVSMNRIKHISDSIDISKDGSAVRFSFGLEVDFMVSETYSFSTGLIYAPKRVGLTIQKNGASSFTEEYKVQYLQIPLSLKLFTSEIQPDIKAFFQLGFLAEIKLYDEPFEKTYTHVEKFQFFDTSFLFGAGVEYGAGVNSIIYSGLFYSRGLVNVVKDTSSEVDGNLVAKMDILNLKLGIKF